MTTNSKHADIETEQDVRFLVGHFYTRIREDAVLGNIFDNIATVDWTEHIPTMCEFWETVLFHRPGYKGNPLLPHIQLDRRMRTERDAGIQPADFGRWIDLFQSTVDELFSGPRAEGAKRGALAMANHMMSAIDDDQHLGIVSIWHGRQSHTCDGTRARQRGQRVSANS